MKILLIILAILFLILMLRIGVTAEYGEEGLAIFLHIGPASIKLPSIEELKSKPKKEKKPKKPKPEKEKKKEEEQEPKKGGKVQLILNLLPVVTDALSSFRRKLNIDILRIHYTSASTDPFKAAMGFGYSSVVIGMVLPFFENNFNLKKRELTSGVDFSATEPTIYIKAKMTIRIISILAVAISAAIKALKVISESKENTGKAE